MRATTSDGGTAAGSERLGAAMGLRPPVFDGLPVDAVVTTRHGGVSHGDHATLNLGLHVGDDPDTVIENRRRAASLVGLTLGDLVFCRQTHRRNVAVVGPADRGRGTASDDDAIPDADAVVTTAPGVGLVVMVADCVPLVLYDPVAHVLGCVHAGWQGTVRRVAEAAVEAMVAEGATPGALLAFIGPAIEADRYQVGDEVAEAARAAFGPAASDVVRPDGTGRWLFDLWGANRRTLVDAGLRPRNVHLSDIGTGDERFFSDRAVRPCGRFAAIAVLHDREKA